MINKSELRIGNRLLYGGKLLIVEPQDFENLDWSNTEGDAITEERLISLKFDTKTGKYPNFNFWSKELDASVDMEISETETLYYYRVFERHRRKQVVYLHDLQNLHFALKGIEL